MLPYYFFFAGFFFLYTSCLKSLFFKICVVHGGSVGAPTNFIDKYNDNKDSILFYSIL